MMLRHPNGGYVLPDTTKAAPASSGRVLSGWASTGAKDRMGDIVVAKGLSWQLPVPILRQHQHASPVGRVLSLRASERGLWMTCELSEGIGEADLLWKQIKAGSVSYWSIGFRSIKMEPIAGGGIRFDSAELLEVSAVAVAANKDCRIEIGNSR